MLNFLGVVKSLKRPELKVRRSSLWSLSGLYFQSAPKASCTSQYYPSISIQLI